MLHVRLLGPPSIEVDGKPVQLTGHKTWGLLCYLLLEERGPTRRELAERLWPEADDPLRAARWTLLQVRRAIAPAEVVEENGRLALRASEGVEVDVRRLLEGTAPPEAVEKFVSVELLEGTSFNDAPAFDSWLTLQRHRVMSACSDAFRWAAVLLARDVPDRALSLVERALVADPYADALHELAVDIHVTRGDRRAAEEYVELVDRRYRTELATGAPDTIRRPLERPPPPEVAVRVDIAAQALLRAAQAKLDTGDYDGALETGRRAASDAASSGDRGLEARALTTLAGALIHTLRGRDHESLGILAHALRLSTEIGDAGLTADIEREFGFVALLDAHYGAAEAALSRSIEWAERGSDAIRAARATTFLGLCQSDRAEYERAAKTVSDAIRDLDRDDARAAQAYARILLARIRLLSGPAEEARELAESAAAQARASGGHSIVPFALAIAGEAAMLQGDLSGAEGISGEAFTLACEIQDPCWEAMSLRVLGHLEARRGDVSRALEMLDDALRRCVRLADTYRWAEAQILTDLVELENGRDPSRVEAAVRLAQEAPMPEFVHRLTRLTSAPQTGAQTPGR